MFPCPIYVQRRTAHKVNMRLLVKVWIAFVNSFNTSRCLSPLHGLFHLVGTHLL